MPNSIPVEIGRAFIEDKMDSACRLWRDAQGNRDDVLDLNTGLLVRPDGDDRLLYEGKCRISPIRPQTAVEIALEGDRLGVRKYKVLLPVAVEDVKMNDRIEITVSPFDPWLVGKSVRVSDVMGRTHGIYRYIVAVDTSDTGLDLLNG